MTIIEFLHKHEVIVMRYLLAEEKTWLYPITRPKKYVYLFDTGKAAGPFFLRFTKVPFKSFKKSTPINCLLNRYPELRYKWVGYTAYVEYGWYKYKVNILVRQIHTYETKELIDNGYLIKSREDVLFNKLADYEVSTASYLIENNKIDYNKNVNGEFIFENYKTWKQDHEKEEDKN